MGIFYPRMGIFNPRMGVFTPRMGVVIPRMGGCSASAAGLGKDPCTTQRLVLKILKKK